MDLHQALRIAELVAAIDKLDAKFDKLSKLVRDKDGIPRTMKLVAYENDNFYDSIALDKNDINGIRNYWDNERRKLLRKIQTDSFAEDSETMQDTPSLDCKTNANFIKDKIARVKHMEIRTETREVNIYVAEDGKEFSSERGCRHYEKEQKRQQNYETEKNLPQFSVLESDIAPIIFDSSTWYYVHSESDIKAIADVNFAHIENMPIIYPTWVGVVEYGDIQTLDEIVKMFEDCMNCLNAAFENNTPENDTVISMFPAYCPINGKGGENGFSMAEGVDCDD